MEIETKKLLKSEIELRISVPIEELNKFQEGAVLKLGKDVEVSGFRKGKAPLEIIEEKIGRERIFKETAELCIKENYTKAIRQLMEEKKIEPLGQPEIEIIKLAPGNPLEFKATIPILPEINLPDYKTIISNIKRREISVSSEEIKEALEWLQQSRAKFIAKTGLSQKGDFVEIKFSSPQIENGVEKKESFILGKGHFIPGFEEALVGMKSGEEKRFSLSLPESASKSGEKGKSIDFKVKMVSVQRTELPDITDEWAKGLGQFENLAALEKNIEEGLVLDKEKTEGQRVRQEIIKKIAEEVEVEVPENLMKEERDRMSENLRKGVAQTLQISFQDYLKQVNKTDEEIKESFLPEARKRVKNSLVLRVLGEREKISVSQEEIEEEINKTLRQYPDVEKAQLQLDLKKVKIYIEGTIKDEKTFQALESFTQKQHK